MQSNVNKFTDPELVDIYNKCHDFVLKTIEQCKADIVSKQTNQKRLDYWDREQRSSEINQINIKIGVYSSFYNKDYFAETIQQVKKHILNGSIIFYAPTININSLVTLKCRIKSNLRNPLLSKCQQIKYTYYVYNPQSTNPNIESIYSPYLYAIIGTAGEHNSVDYNKRCFIDSLAKEILLKDPDVIQKTDSFNAEISKKYLSISQNKKDLLKKLFDNRFDDVSKYMKSRLSDSSIIGNLSTEDLTKVFQVISKFPREITIIQEIINHYDKDIVNMDNQNISAIFDEIKIMQTFK